MCYALHPQHSRVRTRPARRAQRLRGCHPIGAGERNPRTPRPRRLLCRLKGIKGAQKDRYTAVWIYESLDAWTALWGPPDDPIEKPDYPENWKTWEDEVLASYRELEP